MAKLVILTGKHEGKRLDLPEKKLLVGREKTCDLSLRTTEVSRKHCLISIVGDRISVTDLGSRNGTQVNDVPTSGEVVLSDGDTLRIGPMLFRVEIPKPVKKSALSSEHDSQDDSQVLVHEATDDSIVDWLAIDEPDESTGDSTIIRKTSETDTIEAAPLVSVPAPARKEFESVAEEAADIIRRHKEMKAQLQVIQHAK
jgi:pSer/pThr/pTyr-binding forkhead associated (FHA) protein